MSTFTVARFTNYRDEAVEVDVEPWAVTYTLQPKETITVESIHEEDSEIALIPSVDFSCSADGGVLIACYPVRRVHETHRFEGYLPSGARITAPDRVDTFQPFQEPSVG